MHRHAATVLLLSQLFHAEIDVFFSFVFVLQSWGYATVRWACDSIRRSDTSATSSGPIESSGAHHWNRQFATTTTREGRLLPWLSIFPHEGDHVAQPKLRNLPVLSIPFSLERTIQPTFETILCKINGSSPKTVNLYWYCFTIFNGIIRKLLSSLLHTTEPH